MKRGAKNKEALELIDLNNDLNKFEERFNVDDYEPEPDEESEVEVTANRYGEIPDYEEY